MWADGTDEPTSWLVSTTDSEATLQVEGRTGVRARTGASISNGPVLFSFGQFEAYEIPAGVTHSNGATVTLIDSEWVAGLMRVGDGAPDEYGEDGALWLDRTNSRLYAMNSGTWKYAALT